MGLVGMVHPGRSGDHEQFDLPFFQEVPGDEVVHIGTLPALPKRDNGSLAPDSPTEFAFDGSDIDGISEQRTAAEQDVHIGMLFEDLAAEVIECPGTFGDAAVGLFYGNSADPMKRDGQGEQQHQNRAKECGAAGGRKSRSHFEGRPVSCPPCGAQSGRQNPRRSWWLRLHLRGTGCRTASRPPGILKSEAANSTLPRRPPSIPESVPPFP